MSTTETELFDLVANYEPAGDQIKAIDQVTDWIEDGAKHMTIHGITGSGKTFTMANIIKKVNRPAVIYSPNKILAFQLYEELKTFFPNNEVHYYVSTFDLYRPEYVKYGEFHSKQSIANLTLEQYVLDATAALASGRRDVIIVASSSCLFGTGSPEMFKKATIELSVKHEQHQEDIITQLLHAGYQESIDAKLRRGNFLRRNKTMFVCTNQYENKLKIFDLKFDPDGFLSKINSRIVDVETNEISEQKTNLMRAHIFPATRYAQDIYTEEELDIIAESILAEANNQRNRLNPDRYELLVQRIEDDLNSIRSTGYCNGIENYAWYFNRRNFGRRYDPSDYVNMQPYTMMSYLHDDTVFFIDESHLALGQIEGAASADLSRKIDLIEAGIRLPSCVINRPLKKHEVQAKEYPTVYVSATPRPEELGLSEDRITQLFIRPTYLLDPDIEVVYIDEIEKQGIGYNEHIINEITKAKLNGGAVLLRCPSSKVCTFYHQKLLELGFSAEVMLAETPAPERRELVERLQASNAELKPLDVIIGVNLIREGLDIPRVQTVLIVDAHNGGFLNDTTSLIQVIGRAARNAHGKVCIYVANRKKMTPQIQSAIDQTIERRALQMAYNKQHNKTPRTAVANSYLNSVIANSYNPEEDELFANSDYAIERDSVNHISSKKAKAEAIEASRVRTAKRLMQDILVNIDSKEIEDFTNKLAQDPSKAALKEYTSQHAKLKAAIGENKAKLAAKAAQAEDQAVAQAADQVVDQAAKPSKAKKASGTAAKTAPKTAPKAGSKTTTKATPKATPKAAPKAATKTSSSTSTTQERLAKLKALKSKK